MSDNKSEELGKNLYDVLIENKIISRVPTEEDLRKRWIGSCFGGALKVRDGRILLSYSKGKEVVCIRGCFLGLVILIKGKREHFAYIYVKSQASHYSSAFWKRLDVDTAISLFNDGKNDNSTIMFNDEEYKIFERGVLVKSL